MSQINNSKSPLRTNNTKTIQFLKAANSYVLKEDFKKDQIATLPTKIANYFLANKIAEEVTESTNKDKRHSIKNDLKISEKPKNPAKSPAKRKKYVQHPLIVENTIEARLYQEVSFAETVKKNSLVILPTGLGKTIIAVLSSVYWLSQDNDNKVIMFAPTRPLLDQHYENFSNWLNLMDSEVVQITGKTYKKKRLKMFENARMIFMTPQITLDEFNLKDVALMIFDECHRAVRRYRYVKNAEKYFIEAENPHVLGLTATPGTPKKLLSVMRNLQINKVSLANEESSTVTPYIHPIYEEYVKITLPPELMELRNFINRSLRKKLTILSHHPIVKKYVEEKYRINPHELSRIVRLHMGTMGTLKPVLMQVLSLTYLLNLVEAQSLKALEKKLLTLQGSRNPIYQEINSMIIELKRKNIEHPKPKIASEIIQRYCKTHEDSRVLVFVQYLDSLDIVLDELLRNNLKANKLVGQKTMNQDLQREVLNDFKDGKFQVLIATSVAEEGLDVAQCDLVVFYDCIPSGIRTVQRRGRTGRRRAGQLIYLYTEGTWEESFIYISRKRIKETTRILKLMEKEDDPLEFLREHLHSKNK
ncbi:MAG: helicase-related protein [Candidatus Hodarchaeota archaeon]